MGDDVGMRARLQQVAAYRDLCSGVRRSGRENVVFACIMMFLAYLALDNLGARGGVLTLVLYGILIGGELLVGFVKWVLPSAECVILDGLVLLVFGAFNLGFEYLRFQAGQPTSPIILFLGGYMVLGAFGRFRAYGQLRALFAERPTAEHMAWFDDLVQEVRASDPNGDELTLDLPTTPHWKVKLLGTTAFFVAMRGTAIWVAGPDEFELLREKADRGTGRRKAMLSVHGMPYPEFEITDATWANYLKWRAANPGLPTGPQAHG